LLVVIVLIEITFLYWTR